jgi:hypothetical protein
MTEAPAKRYAVIRGKGHADLPAVRRFMPSNYEADSDGGNIWINGVDSMGWTLDGYVIPRLASGLWFAKEVVPMPGLSAKMTAHVTDLGETMLTEAGRDACQEGYGTTDPFWVGHYALGYGDINPDGTMN